VGEDPVMMLTGVIPATRKVLTKAGMTLDQMDAIEINEAFASVVRAWEKELEPDMSKVNIRGGAIALGHPLGASGAKLATTLLYTLQDQDCKYGLQETWTDFGMATATIIERQGKEVWLMTELVKPSTDEVFDMIDAAIKYDPSATEGKEGIYQFYITGDDDGLYQMIIDDDGPRTVK